MSSMEKLMFILEPLEQASRESWDWFNKPLLICSFQTVCTAYGIEILLTHKRLSEIQIKMLIAHTHSFSVKLLINHGLESSLITLQPKIGGSIITPPAVMLTLK